MVETFVYCFTFKTLFSCKGLYHVVGVYDGLCVVGLVSQSDGQVQNLVRCHQLPPHDTQLKSQNTHTQASRISTVYVLLAVVGEVAADLQTHTSSSHKDALYYHYYVYLCSLKKQNNVIFFILLLLFLQLCRFSEK